MSIRARVVLMISLGLAGCELVQPSELLITACQAESDCAGGEVCCADQLCHPSCPAVRPSGCGGESCPDNLKCVNALCVPRDCDEVRCAEDETCANGGCVPTHCGNARCAAGALCINGECNHASCAFVSCAEGARCSLGSCSPTLCGDAVCPEGEVCTGSQCQDTRCAGLSCAAGRCCVRSACVACAAMETRCDNGTDDDGDGATDCADSDCETRACDDGEVCTSQERCAAGQCGGGTASVCTGATQCQQNPGFCAADSGVCRYSPAPNNSRCDDGKPCTVNDVCTGGACAGVVKVCAPLPPGGCFEVAGACGADGGCEYTPKPAGAVCDGGGSCFTGSNCDGAGGCVAVATACTTPGRCEKPAGVCNAGACSYAADPGAPCEVDGNPCTVGVCQSNKSCVEVKAPDGKVISGPEVCCGGKKVDTSVDKEHCGGCATKCVKNNSCVPVTRNVDGTAMTCSPAPLISGRCACDKDDKCPREQRCYHPSGSGSASAQGRALCVPDSVAECVPDSVAECAPGQTRVLVTTCPAGGSSTGPAWCRYP